MVAHESLGTFVFQMEINKTISVIGAGRTKGSMMIQLLLNSGYRLVLVAKDDDELKVIKARFGDSEVIASNITECKKDACWEADIIILDLEKDEENEVADSIRSVVTQKIVVSLNNDHQLQDLFPFSRIVSVKLDAADGTKNEKVIVLEGTDEESLNEIAAVFSTAGIKTHINNQK